MLCLEFRSARPRWSFPSAADDVGRSGHADSATSGGRARRSEYANARRLTTRTSVRRYTRLTNAFSKKVENHVAAVSLHFAHYNLCRGHQM